MRTRPEWWRAAALVALFVGAVVGFPVRLIVAINRAYAPYAGQPITPSVETDTVPWDPHGYVVFAAVLFSLPAFALGLAALGLILAQSRLGLTLAIVAVVNWLPAFALTRGFYAPWGVVVTGVGVAAATLVVAVRGVLRTRRSPVRG